jgi:hypothetical protein
MNICILRLTFFFFLLSSFCGQAQQKAGSNSGFRKHVITTDFISEGVAVGDVNRDGKKDIMAGGFWFEAPTWKRHEILPAKTYNKDTAYSHSFINEAMDVNRDGWIDLMVVDFPGTAATWFENPGNKRRYWQQHMISPAVTNESPTFVDIDGDGRLDLLCADPTNRQMVWFRSPEYPADTSWTKYPISSANAPATDTFSHGLGFGDVNADGYKDVIIPQGWWEGSATPMTAGWKFHPADLGVDCSQMYVMEISGDSLPDVVSASAHLAGIWWHQQLKSDTGGESNWMHSVISYAFAESHALAVADFNGDGHADMTTGKRNLKRNSWRRNPGTHGPPLLYWFECTPGKEPYWIPHQIDDKSGAGLNVNTQDLTNDGKPDIVIANFNGVFLFENTLGKNVEKK